MRTNIKKIVYIVDDLEDAQFRYRVKNIIEVLIDSSSFDVKYYQKKNISKIDLTDLSFLVISRQTAKCNDVLKLISKAKESGVKTLFDLDDLVFDYRDLNIIIKSVREKTWPYWLGYIWGIRRIAKKVDGFICTNEFLAKKLKRSFGKSVKVIRNSLNREQVEISDKIVRKKQARKDVNDEFLIGYFSGSPTHVKDFMMVEPELLRFMDVHKNVKLKVVGYMEFSKQMQEMIKIGRVEVEKPVDYLKLQELMAGVDVNIAPLVINDFTNCKSELKFFEAGVVETTTIASPIYTFKNAIVDGKNGFLVKPGEWYNKLEFLYQNPKENQKIARQAREDALRYYYGKEFLKEVEGVFSNNI